MTASHENRRRKSSNGLYASLGSVVSSQCCYQERTQQMNKYLTNDTNCATVEPLQKSKITYFVYTLIKALGTWI